MSVWEKYGLGPLKLFGGDKRDPKISPLPRSTRFRMALEEAGGIWLLFGSFLAGRSDLLPSPHLFELTKIRPSGKSALQPLLQSQAGSRIDSVRLQRLAPVAEIFLARFQSSTVVVEVYPSEIRVADPKEWKRFIREAQILDAGTESRAVQPVVLEQFLEWLHLSADIERRRTVLANLTEVPSSSIGRYPRLVPDLQTGNCLAYEYLGDAVVAAPGSSGPYPDSRLLPSIVEALLEQSLLLSLVDAECKFEAFAAAGENTVIAPLLPVLMPIPLEWHYELLQYIASTVAGQSPRAIQMLARIASNHDPYASEQRLMRELSGLQPELKINISTPESVTALENFWRALSHTRMQPPLFLHLFHRQWTLVGQANGQQAPDTDLIAEALWPVMGRILRFRASELMSLEKGREWIFNSGLMMLTAARQAGILLEQARDNDVAISLENQDDEPSEAGGNRRILSFMRASLALAVFLVSIITAINASNKEVQLIAGTLSAVSALVLAVFAARIE